MKLTKRDLLDIEKVIAETTENNPIEIRVFKNNLSIFDTTQVFKTKNKFIQALKKLNDFEFENALNGQIGLKKIGNENDNFHIQLYTFEFANEINI